MLDQAGYLISGKNSLRNLYQSTYQERMAPNPIKSGWEAIQNMKEALFESRMQLCSMRKSEPLGLAKVKKICTKLKNGKAMDREDLIKCFSASQHSF